MKRYSVGFTGTQKGMTNAQSAKLAEYMRETDKVYGNWAFHEGDCIGSDDEATHLAWKTGAYVLCHLPLNNSKRAFNPNVHDTYDPKPYLERNHDIVDGSDELVATPAEMTEQLRSGTWATVRYAKKLGKPVRIIYPDGSCTLV